MKALCHECCRVVEYRHERGSAFYKDRFYYHRGGTGKARKRCKASGGLLTVWRGRER